MCFAHSAEYITNVHLLLSTDPDQRLPFLLQVQNSLQGRRPQTMSQHQKEVRWQKQSKEQKPFISNDTMILGFLNYGKMHAYVNICNIFKQTRSNHFPSLWCMYMLMGWCIMCLCSSVRVDVVICLSTTVRNDTLQEVKEQRVSVKCRKQLRVEEVEMVCLLTEE